MWASNVFLSLFTRITVLEKIQTVITKIITTAVIWDSFESEGRSLTCIINCYAYPVIGDPVICVRYPFYQR